MYQPATGYWRQSSRHLILWAIYQVLVRKALIETENPVINRWARRITETTDRPVQEYDLESWYGRVFKAAEDVPVPDEIVAAFTAVATDLIPQLWFDSAEFRTRKLGLPFHPEDLAASMAGIGDEIRGVSDSFRSDFQRLAWAAYEAPNVSQFEFAMMIRQKWPGIARARSETIALTEWNRAASAATQNEMKRLGYETKFWITAGDSRVCPVCADNAASGDIPVDESFASGEDYPPAHPRCRCNVTPGPTIGTPR